MLLLSLPCVVTLKTIFKIWLVAVTPLAVEFTQIAIIGQIIESISSSTYIPFVASGKLKSNALWGIVTGGGYFVALYLIFEYDGGALWVQWLYLLLSILGVFILRPYLLHKEVGFNYKEIFICIWDCFKPFGEELWEQVTLFITDFILTGFVIWAFLEKPMRVYVHNYVKLLMNKIR